MNNKFIHIIIAYVFHIALILMSFTMMQSHCSNLQTSFIVLGILYLIYWIICNRKSYMPWCVYLHFGVGVLVQIILNSCGIIPEDGGWFAGLGQFFYKMLVIIHAVIVGVANLILYVIQKRKMVKNN